LYLISLDAPGSFQLYLELLTLLALGACVNGEEGRTEGKSSFPVWI